MSRKKQLTTEEALTLYRIHDFVRASNLIEGITREPTREELDEMKQFLKLRELTVSDVSKFVSVCQPGAILRNRPGLDVRIGNYIPPRGHKDITKKLDVILNMANKASRSPYEIHQLYQRLHPYTDGNGRSGRAIWAWTMKGIPNRSFLHEYYYQSFNDGGFR